MDRLDSDFLILLTIALTTTSIVFAFIIIISNIRINRTLVRSRELYEKLDMAILEHSIIGLNKGYSSPEAILKYEEMLKLREEHVKIMRGLRK